MPIYTYKCPECELKTERLMPMVTATTSQEIECECGATAKKTVADVVSFKFVGSGFYQNDYRGKEKIEKDKRAQKEKDKNTLYILDK